MPNCRDIPPEAWGAAHQALLFYFSRRFLVSNAEDLAQQTLLAVWSRPDFSFTRHEDFQKVCYGFAANVLTAERRKHAKGIHAPLNPNMAGPSNISGPQATEDLVFLREVIEKAPTKLTEEEWKLIGLAAEATLADAPYRFAASTANKLRVRLHRVRKKLALKMGWDR